MHLPSVISNKKQILLLTSPQNKAFINEKQVVSQFLAYYTEEMDWGYEP